MRLILNIIWLVFGGLWLALGYLVAALVFYALAKLLEHYDHGVFALTGGAVSGHSIKHLLAALAPAAILAMMRQWPRDAQR